MITVLNILLLCALAAVVIVLGMGVYALSRGGEFGAKWSNRLMRLRVAVQFVAILLLAAAFWFSYRGH